MHQSEGNEFLPIYNVNTFFPTSKEIYQRNTNTEKPHFLLRAAHTIRKKRKKKKQKRIF